MIDYETFCQIRLLHDQKKLKASQIAEELHLDPKTVEKWIRRPTYQPRQSPRRSSILDRLIDSIVAMLERHPYTAQQILQRLREQGYVGGYTILKEFVRKVRPVRNPRESNDDSCGSPLRTSVRQSQEPSISGFAGSAFAALALGGL